MQSFGGKSYESMHPSAYDFNGKTVQFDTTWLRWPLLFFFINNIMYSGSMSLSLAPASSYISTAYDVSIVEVNMCCLIFTVTFIPMTFLQWWLSSKIPSHWILRLAALLLLVGSWFRSISLATNTFWPVLIGQTIISLA